MRTKTWLASIGILSLIAAAGCTPEARKDVSEAGQNVGQATEKSVEGTADAAGKAVDATGKVVENAAEATGNAVQATGQAVEQGAENAAEAVGGTVKNAAEATGDLATAAALTPKVKNALIADKTIDASTINVDTKGTKDAVVLRGSVPSEAVKKKAEQITKKVLTDSQSTYKVINQLTVGGKMSGGAAKM